MTYSRMYYTNTKRGKNMIRTKGGEFRLVFKGSRYRVVVVVQYKTEAVSVSEAVGRWGRGVLP